MPAPGPCHNAPLANPRESPMLLRRLCLLALLAALPAGAAELKIDLGHGAKTLESSQLATRRASADSMDAALLARRRFTRRRRSIGSGCSRS